MVIGSSFKSAVEVSTELTATLTEDVTKEEPAASIEETDCRGVGELVNIMISLVVDEGVLGTSAELEERVIEDKITSEEVEEIIVLACETAGGSGVGELSTVGRGVVDTISTNDVTMVVVGRGDDVVKAILEIKGEVDEGISSIDVITTGVEEATVRILDIIISDDEIAVVVVEAITLDRVREAADVSNTALDRVREAADVSNTVLDIEELLVIGGDESAVFETPNVDTTSDITGVKVDMATLVTTGGGEVVGLGTA